VLDLAAFWKTIDSRILNSPRASPSVITIPRDHIDRNRDGSLNGAFRKDHHYFHVMVNEMYLSQARKWFNTIDPVVYVVAEFTYQGKRQIAPYLVGPGLLKERGVPDRVAHGTMLRNTSVAGPYPYRGGGLTLSVVLCEAQNQNVIKPLLKILESTAGALGFSLALGPYVKVASILMDGFEALMNSGGATPLAGLRDSYGPNFGTPFRPAYFALIDEPAVDLKTLWVRENQLVRGTSLEAAEPYRGADFVLYSIGTPDNNTRDDVEELPFNELWNRVKQEAASPVKDPNFKNAVQLMVTLYQSIVLSPDLTEGHADNLAEEYNTRMRKIHADAEGMWGHLEGGEEGDETKQRMDRARKMALSLVNA
jgi:hypothetical protein